ncbi:MAG: hypothetical protein DME97_16935 [Verrucomicrobia bacterium]|nr:MAG: hypothetical protein DME97_16935 [Verrucomicrobiota bacterium]
MNYSRLLPAAALLAIFITGCSSTNKPAVTTATTAKRDGKLFVVSVESAPFFRHGPQTGVDPDKTLSKETVVKLIRPSFGYSKVELVATGEQGYVSSEEIRPASSALLASVSALKADPLATPSTQPSVEQFNLNSSDPRLVPPPEDLPPAELPAPAPEQ